MPLTVKTSDFIHPVDSDRAGKIVSSLGMQDIDGELGAPFPIEGEWPLIFSLRGNDCNGRMFCTGCERLTLAASGVVYTILKNEGKQAVGAVCSSSIKDIPFFPVFFTRSVDRN